MPGLDPCPTLAALLAIMHTLRAPGGCPWDAAQTPASLAPYLIEEACETVDAIETGDTARIVDELGDLLLQIVFQAEIHAEDGLFDFADVAAGITAKLVRRHPHVFAGSALPSSAGELDRQWQAIKRREQGAVPEHPLARLPAQLPALQRAQKLIARAGREGVALALPPAAATATLPATAEELGRALLALVHQAERCGIDAEQALRQSVRQLADETAAPPGGAPGERPR